MDIRQLRVGNLVTTNGKPAGTKKGGIYKVIDTNSANRLDELGLVGDATLQILDGDYTTCVGAWVDYLEPIELNFTLLEKIGFNNIGGTLYLNIDKYEISITCDSLDSYDGVQVLILSIYNNVGEKVMDGYWENIECLYLNILQNIIYDITGLDLNVDNLITK